MIKNFVSLKMKQNKFWTRLRHEKKLVQALLLNRHILLLDQKGAEIAKRAKHTQKSIKSIKSNITIITKTVIYKKYFIVRFER